MSQKCNLLRRTLQVKEQVSETVARRLQFLKVPKLHRKISVLESLFHKVASLKACNSVKKRLQGRFFPMKCAKFLRTTFFLQNCCSDCFWGLALVFKGVRDKNRCDFLQYIPDLVEKGILLSLLRKDSSIATFLRTPILKNICDRLPLKISTSVTNFLKEAFLFNL